MMEVKIGIQSVPRELIIETDETQAEIEAHLEGALAAYLLAGTPNTEALAATERKQSPVFTLTTTKGGRVLIPADKIAFIEFSTDQARRIGFGNIV
jgi:hypothetical protein